MPRITWSMRGYGLPSNTDVMHPASHPVVDPGRHQTRTDCTVYVNQLSRWHVEVWPSNIPALGSIELAPHEAVVYALKRRIPSVPARVKSHCMLIVCHSKGLTSTHTRSSGAICAGSKRCRVASMVYLRSHSLAGHIMAPPVAVGAPWSQDRFTLLASILRIFLGLLNIGSGMTNGLSPAIRFSS